MKAAVLLSGGVDSSVALHLARRQGARDLTAFYLKIWLEDDLAFLGDCPWEEDLRYARAICDQAGVELRVISLQSEYEEQIVRRVLAELRAGRTPSPDILCNQHIKFGLFLDKIDLSFEKVVSGHYAQVEERAGIFYLKRSPDPVKDQTYFLSTLNQRQLRRAWFPIGHLRKSEARQLAAELHLPNRDRKDSQGICFLGKIKYPEFVRFHLGERKGAIVEIETGRKLAEHSGVWFYTIGQRKGIGLSGGPWYVVKKDLPSNTLFVSNAIHLAEHARDRFTIADVHWIAREPAARALQVKIRHAPQRTPAEIEPLADNRWEIRLSIKDPGVAPGQSAVLYQDEVCLGSGMICD